VKEHRGRIVKLTGDGALVEFPSVVDAVKCAFENLSRDPDQEYFADGITDDLTTDLSRISGSFVIARNTAFTFKGKAADVKQIGRELGVHYVIEGSVRRAGDRVQVNVQLIDAETGAHLWADRFDTDRNNLAEAQSEITGRLARSLHLELLEVVSRRIERDKTANPDARDLVMRGWAVYWRPFSVANREEGRRLFEQALEIDPQSVDARVGIANVLVSNIVDGWSSSPQQDEARIEALLREALEHDPNAAMVHWTLGLLRRIQVRLPESQNEFEIAIALDRNFARAIFQVGLTLFFLGQPQAAIPYIEKAIRLNPNDSNLTAPYWGLGSCHLLLGEVDQAVELLQKARAANPRFWWPHIWLAGALGLKGDLGEAKVELAEALKLKPNLNSLAAWRADRPWEATPQMAALAEKTFYLGLRRAGFPDK
jgi:TolB-like protein